ncbi:MAG: S41 family peptidase [Bacteroidota bacterium]
MTKNSRLSILLPILLTVVFALGFFFGAKIFNSNGRNTFSNQTQNNGNKINEIIQYIDDNYVDTVNHKKLIDISIASMLETLDPHSNYITAEELNSVNESLEGSFDGIGIEFNIQRDTIMVVSAIPGGPSEKMGILAGDRIVKIDNKKAAGVKITNDQVFKKLRGKAGTIVTISILRNGHSKLADYTIERDKIPSKSIDTYYMITNEIGFIKLNKFSLTSYDEFLEGVKSLMNQGMKKLIFDLRGNGGGYLNAAIDICDEFLPKNKLIVYTEGKSRPRKDYFATRKGILTDIKVLVLIDEFSASASEIVAGAIQDNDRGLIAGRRSFGKGLVQEQIEMADGSALRLTVARYHTPTGRCIQKPYGENISDYYDEFAKRFTDGELKTADSIKFNDSLKYKTPAGNVVYGGGGIMPDKFISIDTVGTSMYLNQLAVQGVINQFAFNFVDKNRENIKKTYKNAAFFVANFNVTPAMFDELIKIASVKGIEKNDKQIATSQSIIKAQMKALIGRNLFGSEAFYPVIFKIDETYTKAIDLIKNM